MSTQKIVGDQALSALVSDIKSALSEKANTVGEYESLVSGLANNLKTDKGEINKTPYLFRPSFSNGYGYETLIGGTCGVNQLVQNGNFADNTGWSYGNGISSISVNNNELTANITHSANADIRRSIHYNYISGHKFLVFATVKATGDCIGKGITLRLFSNDYSENEALMLGTFTANSTQVFGILNKNYAWSSASYFMLGINEYPGVSLSGTIVYKGVCLIDLTAYFGTTIADYVYTLESGTSGAGITWLKNNGFDFSKYAPYNAGGLLSVKTSKKITTGKNLLNNADILTWKVYGNSIFSVDSSDNLIVEAQDSIAEGSETQFISLPAGTYTLAIDNPQRIQIAWGGVKNVDVFNTTNVQFTLTEFRNDIHFKIICSSYPTNVGKIRITFGSTPSAYEPYISHEYPLDGSRKVHRVFGIVDLGTLDYAYYGGRFNTVSAFNDIGGELVSDYYVNVICAKYVNSSSGNDKTFFVYNNKYIYIYDSDYTDATAFKNSLDGVYLVYELATPFDETVSNPELRGVLKLDSDNNLYYYGDTCSDFTNPMLVDGNGTEEFVDTRAVQMPVGHSTFYLEDLKTKLENAPDFTDITGTLTAGNTSITLSSAKITTNSTIDFYTDKFGVNPTNVTVTNGSVTLTFEAQASNLGVKVRVS